MALMAGRHRIGPDRNDLALRTFRDGLAATAGHDLTIEITRWSAELTIGDDGIPSALSVEIDLNSLKVTGGTGGLKPLTDRDRREIVVSAAKTLGTSRKPDATFVASGFQPGADGGGTVTGTLSMAGAERPVQLRVLARPPAGYHVTATIVQSQFGIKPYSAFLGALRVRDAVDVEADIDLSGAVQAGPASPARPVRPWPVRRRSMTAQALPAEPGAAAAALFDRRAEPVRYLAGHADTVAAAAHLMARRFHAGAKLVTFGIGGASTDAQHVAVEFVHPVIVGKRALPAISLSSDLATITGVASAQGMAAIFAHQIRYLAEPADIALGICAAGDCPSVLAGLVAARERGMATIALVGDPDATIASSGAADIVLAAPSPDPRIVKEIQVSTYHLLWELVHLFFEQPGVIGPGVVA